jgi:hypothetical protein
MKKSIIIINFIMLYLFFITAASARSSEEFINQVTDMVCEDCQGKDIQLSQPMTFTSNDSSINYTTKSISWPYDRSFVKIIIEGIDKAQFSDIQGTCEDKIEYTSGPGILDGCGILKCGNYKLNVIGDSYYWNGTKIDFLKKEEMNNVASGNNNTQVINSGDKNAVNIGNNNIGNTGENSIITKQDLYLWFSGGFAIGAILVELLNLYVQWRKKKGGSSA